LTADTSETVTLAFKGITICVTIAKGHKPQVHSITKSNPGMIPATASQQWVAQRYENWITGNITGAFSFKNVCQASFDVVLASCAERLRSRA
jgi:hypothetical protein